MSTTTQASRSAEPPTVDETDFAHGVGVEERVQSEDWSEEIAALTELERQLATARGQLETDRANVGSLEQIILVSRYARLGKFTAALLGSHEEWPGSEMLEWIAEAWSRIDSTAIADQTPEQLAHWRRIADSLGISHDGEEIETCAEDGCDESLDDGEGYDGYCGTHADQREAAGVYS